MKEKYREIEVSGRGQFPYDMLRYGQCYPVTTTDAHNIESDARERRTVKLASHCNSMHMMSTIERFRSFMWAAEEVNL
jgi:hypothetical protein